MADCAAGKLAGIESANRGIAARAAIATMLGQPERTKSKVICAIRMIDGVDPTGPV